MSDALTKTIAEMLSHANKAARLLKTTPTSTAHGKYLGELAVAELNAAVADGQAAVKAIEAGTGPS